jgi:thioredoxin reductase (NADPH)
MSNQVILYSTTGCPFCQRYKELFAQHNQPFEERNTTSDPRFLDELAARGIFSLPTVIVNGAPIPGFRPNSVLELLSA